MINDLFWRKLASAGALSALVYLFFGRWHNWFLGWLILFFYFLFVSVKTEAVLINYFDFVKSLRIRLVAFFLSLVTLGWFLGIFIFFNYFNDLAIFLSFFVNALVWSFINQSFSPLLGERQREGYTVNEDARINTPPPAPPLIGEGDLELPHKKISVLIYFGLVAYGFYLLAKSGTGGTIFSPWQTIDHGYVWVFLSATFLLGTLILLSKVSVKTLLFFVILQSFLLHSYLPLTHDLFYGADGWRHIANEQRLADGKDFKEAELSTDINSQKSEVQSLKSKVGLLSYANFWGTNVVLAKMLQVDLVSLTKWFLPILWSVIFTILLYEIGLTLGWGGRKSLLLAWSGMLPFALQAGGSFSLPVNFGLLIFVLFFLLLLKRVKEPNAGQRNILLALGVGSAFGYLLFFVLYWLSWGISEVLKLKVIRFVKLKKFILFLIILLFIPAVEVLAGYSQFDKSVNILAQAKQFIGNIFAFYLASGPRPHDISGGNILFNQMPASIFMPNLLIQWLWWLPVFIIAAFVFIILGIIKNRKDQIYKFILAIFVILLTSYFLSFYLLAGERMLSRRLDATLAFLFLILLFYGLEKTTKNPTLYPSPHRGGSEEVGRPLSPSPFRGGIKGGVLVLIILSLAITASYSLGPDTFTVSSNQLAAVKYIWSQEKDSSTHCVMGDIYPLLALEAVSQKEIIGGGFPIDANFGQPERAKVYEQMHTGYVYGLFSDVAGLNKAADHCWLFGEKTDFNNLELDADKTFGDMAVLRYNTKY